MIQRFDRQGGWVGMLVILIALLVVAWMSKDALLKYGMLSGGATVVQGGAAATGEGRAPDTTGAVGTVDPGPSAPAASTPMEQARALEELVKRAAESAAAKPP